MTWPVPSQPGVGHLISRFSGLEGSRDCGKRAVGSRLADLEGKRWKGERNGRGCFPPLLQSNREKPLCLDIFFPEGGIVTLEVSKIKISKAVRVTNPARSMEPFAVTEQAARLSAQGTPQPPPSPSCCCGQTPTTALKPTWILNQPCCSV